MFCWVFSVADSSLTTMVPSIVNTYVAKRKVITKMMTVYLLIVCVVNLDLVLCWELHLDSMVLSGVA